ncbi:unnamed protein product [Ectocarpus fasciculatus]
MQSRTTHNIACSKKARAKGGQVPDTHGSTTCLFGRGRYIQVSALSVPTPFKGKTTFRRLVQALYGTTYSFRPDNNATGSPHKIDPCERVAVFLFRVPGGQGVLQTAGHFEVPEESVEDWTSQVARLLVERLRSQRVSGSASVAHSAILAAGSNDSGGAASSSARSDSRPASKEKGKGKGTRDTTGRGTRGFLDEELAERTRNDLAALSGKQGTTKRKRPWHPNDMFIGYDAKRSQERNKLLDKLLEKALRGTEVQRREIALRKAEMELEATERRHNHLFALHRAGRLEGSQLRAAIFADFSPELRKTIEAAEQDEARAGGGAGSRS